MYKNQMRRLNRRNNNRINGEVWLAIFVNVAALWIAYENLQYNRADAYQSARIADQLRTLNRSNLMLQINNELCKEKEEKTCGQLRENEHS